MSLKEKVTRDYIIKYRLMEEVPVKIEIFGLLFGNRMQLRPRCASLLLAIERQFHLQEAFKNS